MSNTPWTDERERVGKIRSSSALMGVVPAVYVRELETELADARAEIAADEARLIAYVARVTGELQARDALIEQMREALKRLCYECEPAGHDIRGCMFKACKWCDAKAALSARADRY